MADQTFRKVEGIVTDVPVKIHDHFIPIDFQVIDMGEDEYDPPIILGRPFLSTVKSIIYIGTGEVHMHFPTEKVCPEETVAPNQVWKEKKVVIEEEAPPKPPSTPSNES